jgi:hypothetical protein
MSFEIQHLQNITVIMSANTRTNSNLSMSPFNDATGENNYLDLINTFKQNCELSFNTFVIKDYCYARNKLYVSILIIYKWLRRKKSCIKSVIKKWFLQTILYSCLNIHMFFFYNICTWWAKPVLEHVKTFKPSITKDNRWQ